MNRWLTCGCGFFLWFCPLASPGAIVINEIMYHPAPGIPEPFDQEWIELSNPGTTNVNLTGWRLSGAVEFTFGSFSIPSHGFCVVAADTVAFQTRYPGVTPVVGNWTGTLADHGNHITLMDAAGQEVDDVAYASQGDWALRIRGPNDQGHFGWQWFTEAEGLGKSLELINPNLPNQHGQNWAASLLTYGTPGAINSVLSTNIAPLILETAHFPLIPGTANQVTITARVLDEQTNGLTVTLFYRDATSVNPPPFDSLPMADNGQQGDGAANDGVFGVVLPSFFNGTVVEYYVQASDGQSNARTWPAAARQLDGFTLAQTANALFQVDSSENSNTQPTFRLIMTETERQELDSIGRNVNGAADSDAAMNGTFISVAATGTELRYLTGFRNRGHGSRASRPNNVRVNFANDQPWHGVRAIILNTQTTHSQVGASAVFQKAGLPAAYSQPVQVRVNGSNLANAGAPQYGSYAFNEEISSEFVQRHWPTDPNGNAYRGVRIDSPSTHADFAYLGPDADSCLSFPNCYRNLYFKETNEKEDNWTDLIDLCNQLNNASDEEYVSQVERVLNVDNWLLYFAVNTLADNRETSLSNGNGDDYAMYRGVIDPRFQLQPYDMDTLFSQGDTAGQFNASLFRMTNIVSGTVPYAITRFISHPQFVPRYYGTLKRLIETSFSPAQINPTFVRALGDWVPSQTISNMVSWSALRNDFVLSRIPLQLTVSTTLIPVNGYPRTTSPTVDLTGQGNAIDTRTIRVANSPADWSALSATWSATVSGLQPGINRLLVQAFGTNGLEIARTNIDIWYDAGSGQTAAGTISSDTTWTATTGPYRITSSLTVASGATLSIQAGTTVYLDAGVNLNVADGGRLLIEGTELAPVRLTRLPGIGANWGQLVITGSAGSPETRLRYVHFDFNANNTTTPCIRVNGGTVWLDHLTFGNTGAPYVSLEGASFVVSDCVFPTASALFELVHGTGGIKAGGRGIFRNNYFGHPMGYNDSIDFTGGNRPAPILQFFNNIFDGASDDCLDLDSTDAWIEGNVFLHAHRDPSRTDDARDTAAAISGGVDFAGQFSEWTIINNLFYDVDHALLNKGGNSAGAGRFVFVNNTLVHVNKENGAGLAGDIAAFDFTDDGVLLPAADYGAGAYVAGNIIWDCPQLVANYNAANHTVIFENNLLPMAWNGPGTNNTVADPHLNLALISDVASANAQTVRAALTPQPGSPAIAMGLGGVDQGGLNAPGAIVYGEPQGTTASTNATLRVAPGTTFNWGNLVPPYEWGYTQYRWKLDAGPWSAANPIAAAINLTNLSNGPHTVYVAGRNDAGSEQDDATVYGTNGPLAAHVTASHTWMVAAGYSRLVLNEVLARNVAAVPHGETFPDLIELYNAGGTTINLAGLGLTDDPTEPFKFIFGNGTSLGPGQYLVLFADDPDGSPGNHLGFGLDADGDAVYLYDSGTNLIDSVAFGAQLSDLSIGRLADGTWSLTRPTLGGPNLRQPVGDPRRLKISEWLAASQNGAQPDFIELYNPDSLPVSLGGLFLSDAPQGSPAHSPIVALTFVAGNGFRIFLADGQPEIGPGHLDFKLSADQGQIALFDADVRLIDCVFYRRQVPDVSEGRQPSGANTFAYFAQPTPGGPNPGSLGNCTVSNVALNLLPMQSTWRYNRDGFDLGTAWQAPDYNDSGWLSGDALLGVEDCGCLPFALNTFFPNYSNSQIIYYFRTSFQVATNLAGFDLTLTYVLDDGAVVYLDGLELIRFQMPAGNVTSGTLPTSTINNATLETRTLGNLSLAMGTHVLAVEVHNSANPTSSDIVWGLALDATHSETNCVQASVILNEVMANSLTVMNSDGTFSDWVELYNPSASELNLSDLSLTDDPMNPRRWVFPSDVRLAAGAYLIVGFDPTRPPSLQNEAALNAGFGFKAEGDRVYLFDSLARAGAGLDSIAFGLQATDFTIGRIPNASGAWQLTLPTPGGPNIAASLGNATLLKVNEWMADPKGGSDWFELFNPNAQPVKLSGLYLTDDLNKRTQYLIPPLSFLGVGQGAYVQFLADDNAIQGAQHTNFKLDGDGESIGIFTDSGDLINGVTFPLQEEGVSEGRFPDGSAQLTRFRGTATPGSSNLLPLPDIVINEVLSHTDSAFEDAIELHNLALESIDLGGWYLTDNKNAPRRYRIPDGTIISAGGFVVVYENQFNPGALGRPPDFALSSARGDEVYLFSAEPTGELRGYRTGVEFGAAENAVSMGRYLSSVGVDFVALSNRTFGVDNPATVQQFRMGGGLSNAAPVVGPIVINEIMYHPPDVGMEDDSLNEFIELKNISAATVSLFDTNHTTNTWRFRDAVDFNFPTGTILAAGEHLLAVSFNPTNTALATALRMRYGLAAGVKIVGPYQGKLANDADNIELYKPDNPTPQDQPDAGFVPYVLVDKVRYQDSAPWPTAADGNTNGIGVSLQRRTGSAYGNDPVNWLAGVPTPAAGIGPAVQALPVITALSPSHTVLPGANETLTVNATAGPLRVQWRFNGIPIANATNLSLTLNNVQAAQQGFYGVVVSNPAGAAAGRIFLEVAVAPVITRDPQSIFAAVGQRALFSVTVRGSSPLTYQWRKGASDLAGATNATLVITNVQASDAANYSVLVSNSRGTATSAAASLTLSAAPVIVTPPQSASVFVGANLTLNVVANGSLPLRYQWRLNSANILNATNFSLVLTNLQVANSGNYDVRVSNSSGAVLSPPANVTVTVPPMVTITAPDNTAAEPGSNTGQFTIGRTGGTGLPLTVLLTVSGSAAPSADYTALPSSIIIPAGAVSANLLVQPLNDAVRESDEGVVVTLASSPTYALGTPFSATVTILDDDNMAPTVTLISPTEGAVYTPPTNILVRASAMDPDGTVFRVEFFNGTEKLGEAFAMPYSFSWSDPPVGASTLTAVASDEFGRKTVSAPIHITINQPRAMGFTDRFDDRGLLVGYTNFVYTNNSAFTRDAGEPFHFAGTTGTNSAWISWLAPASGNCIVSTVATGLPGVSNLFDTVLAVYTGTVVSSLTRIVNNDDGPGSVQSRTNFMATAGTVYHVAVAGFNATAKGSIYFRIYMPSVPPGFTAEPENILVDSGQPAAFLVTTIGSPPLFYQWQLDDAPIEGATNATLSWNSVKYGDAGTYKVWITNASGMTSSQPAQLLVRPRLIGWEPLSQGRLQLTFQAMPGRGHALLRASNFVDWVTVQTFTNSMVQGTLQETNATTPGILRTYRLRLIP